MISLPRIIGHRGAAALAPENTYAGFRRAAEHAPWVEFDTRLAADGLAVLHDATLDRTTDASGPVRGRTIAELADIDAGAWFGAGYRAEPVPTLAGALAEIARLRLGANVELKADPGRERELAHSAADVIRQAWPESGNLLVSSFSVPALTAFAEYAPEIPCGLLVEELTPGWQATAQGLRCRSVHADYRWLTKPGAQAVKEAGFILAVYTVNLVQDARRMLDLGADSIITDRPDLIEGCLPR